MDVVRCFDNRVQSFLNDASVNCRGTVRVRKSSGAHLTSEVELSVYEDFLRKKSEAGGEFRYRKLRTEKEREQKMDYPETPSEVRRLAYMSVWRSISR